MIRYIKLITFSSLIMMTALMAIGCNQDSRRSNGTNDMMSERQDYRQKIDDAREKIDDRIAELQKDLVEASESTKAEINTQLENLNDMRNDLGDKLARLDNTSEDQWEQFKAEVDGTLKRIEEQMKDVKREAEEAMDRDDDNKTARDDTTTR